MRARARADSHACLQLQTRYELMALALLVVCGLLCCDVMLQSLVGFTEMITSTLTQNTCHMSVWANQANCELHCTILSNVSLIDLVRSTQQ